MGKDKGLEKLTSLIADPSRPVLPRGEIWVVPEVLAAVGFDQRPKGLVELASMMRVSKQQGPCDIVDLFGFLTSHLWGSERGFRRPNKRKGLGKTCIKPSQAVELKFFSSPSIFCLWLSVDPKPELHMH
jgi:hypothetical protein